MGILKADKDMQLPFWVGVMGAILMVAGFGSIFAGFVTSPGWYAAALLLVPLGFGAILCWQNQWVELGENGEMTYSTFLGRQKHYHVNQIRGIRVNPDSMTLLLEDGKIHIESVAILSDRFEVVLKRTLDRYAQEKGR